MHTALQKVPVHPPNER